MHTQSPLLPAKNHYARVFFMALGTAFVLFLPFMIIDQGYFIFYGDFNVQQIPFYQMTHDAIREGNILWNNLTDLGTNFIGSYTFYNLGSPFFWLTLPFPSEVVPYLMAPLLMLKMAVAAVTAYAYIARFVRNKEYAVIGALLYAFSGFSIYNIFFNHFHEPMAFFPLLLIALEEYMDNNRRGVLALAVFLNCLTSYFFFAGQVVFILVYWFYRMLSNHWKITLRKFFGLIFEAVIGVLMTMILVLPAALVTMANPRTNQSFTGFSAIIYGYPQRYGAIFETFFFPPDIPARPNFFPAAENKWASLGAWLPVFSMAGVIAFMSSKRGHWLKRVLITLFVMAFVPLFNSAFFMFNQAYYARWFYMLVLMMALATVKALEDKAVNMMRGLKITAGITAVIVLLIGFLPDTVKEGEPTKIGLAAYPDRFWVYSAIAVISLAILYILIRVHQKSPQQFYKCAVSAVVGISVIYSIYMISIGKVTIQESRDFIIPYSLNGGEDIDLPEADNYRIDVLNGTGMALDNQAMFWQRQTIQAFHSLVPASVMEFYNQVGVQRDVGSRPERNFYVLRPFLSVRYLFDRQEMAETSVDKEHYEYVDWQNGYYIYENKNYIPMGFTYDHYILRSEFDSKVDNSQRKLLLQSIVIEDEDIANYSDILPHMDINLWLPYADTEIAGIAAARATESCDTFAYDNRGFSATIDLSKGNLVFFTVPWEEGWSAQVNGVPAEIIKTNVGFMAVYCPPGSSAIRFNYMTPGLIPGSIISISAAVIFAAYLLICRRMKRRASVRQASLPASPAKDSVFDLDEDTASAGWDIGDPLPSPPFNPTPGSGQNTSISPPNQQEDK